MLFLKPLEEEDYAALTTGTLTSSSQKSQKLLQTSNSTQSPSTSLSSPSFTPTSSLAPFQKSKYSVNYLEIKFSSLSPQSHDSFDAPYTPTKTTAKNPAPFQSSPHSSPLSSSFSSPSKFMPANTHNKEKQPPMPSPTTEHRPYSPTTTTSPLLSRSSKFSVTPKADPVMIGIYGSEPGLKYVESNEKLRQLDTRLVPFYFYL